jgi:hypothetical protein
MEETMHKHYVTLDSDTKNTIERLEMSINKLVALLENAHDSNTTLNMLASLDKVKTDVKNQIGEIPANQIEDSMTDESGTPACASALPIEREIIDQVIIPVDSQEHKDLPFELYGAFHNSVIKCFQDDSIAKKELREIPAQAFDFYINFNNTDKIRFREMLRNKAVEVAPIKTPQRTYTSDMLIEMHDYVVFCCSNFMAPWFFGSGEYMIFYAVANSYPKHILLVKSQDKNDIYKESLYKNDEVLTYPHVHPSMLIDFFEKSNRVMPKRLELQNEIFKHYASDDKEFMDLYRVVLDEIGVKTGFADIPTMFYPWLSYRLGLNDIFKNNKNPDLLSSEYRQK